jgi:hypothetical protein
MQFFFTQITLAYFAAFKATDSASSASAASRKLSEKGI